MSAWEYEHHSPAVRNAGKAIASATFTLRVVDPDPELFGSDPETISNPVPNPNVNPSLLKGVSHEIDFKTFDKNLQNLV
jgi:hypothetical protein